MPISAHEMTDLTRQIRTLTERLSSEQVLDLADVLHDVIRDRQIRARRRSWTPQAATGQEAG